MDKCTIKSAGAYMKKPLLVADIEDMNYNFKF